MKGSKKVSTPYPGFALPSRVSPDDLQALHASLSAHATSAFTVSAAAWRSFDSLTLQLLLSAARDWALRGQRFLVTDVSPDMATTFHLIGLCPDMLTWECAA